MAFFKITYVFRTADAGWTEIFYDEADNLDTFKGPRANEKTAVMGPRGYGVTWLSSKVTEEGGLRRSKIFPINLDQPQNSPFNDNLKDVSEVTAKVRLNFSGGGGRILNVRGVPDLEIRPEYAKGSSAGSGLESRLDSYINFITRAANPFLGKQLKPITEAGYEWMDVIAMKADTVNPMWTRVTVSELQAPLEVGTEIYFKGVDRLQIPWITGHYRTVGLTDVDGFSIPTQFRYPAAQFDAKNVQFRLAGYDYPAITDGKLLRIGTRQTAGPFGLRRGARSRLKTR